MASPSIGSGLSQLNASDANTWNSGQVGNANAAIPSADLAVSTAGINPPNTCNQFEGSSVGYTSGQKYSAYSDAWTAVDISAANQAILLHFAGNPAQFNQVSTDSDGITIYAFDSGAARTTDYLLKTLGGSGDDFYKGAAVFYPVLLFSASATSNGTIDDTDIVEVGVAYKAGATGQFGVQFKIDQVLHIDGEVHFNDGDGTTGGTWKRYRDLVYPEAAGTIYNGSNAYLPPAYGFGFPVRMNCERFTDSNFTFIFLPVNSAQAFFPPTTGYYSLSINPTSTTSIHNYTDGTFAFDSGTYALDIDSTGFTSGSLNFTRCTFLNTGSVTIDGSATTMSSCTISSPASLSIANADLGLAVTSPGAAIQWTSDLVSGSRLTTGGDLDITFAETDLSDITLEFTGSNTVTVSPTTGSGTYDLTGITSTGTVTFDNDTANNTTVTVVAGLTTAVASPTTGGGTVTVSQPASTYTINSSEASSDIRIFTTTTQTELDSATSNTLAYVHSNETVDVTVQKAGFLPQRFTGIVLSGNSTLDVTLVSDPVYDSSHGLTYTTDASWARATSLLTVPTFGPSSRAVHSLMIDSFISESSLRNTEYKIQMNGSKSMFLVNDAEGASDASIENMTASGVRYVNSSGTTTAEWCGIESIGTATGFTGEYQQQVGTGTTDARATGKFDEIIKIYGDASHGNFDYRGHLVLKFQPNGYLEERVDVLSTYGISALEPEHYIVAMQPISNDVATGDPAISITVVDHTASPLVVGGKSFNFEIQDNGSNDGTAMVREWNYNKSLDATYQTLDPFNWPDFLVKEGEDFITAYGYVEGESGLQGCYVSRSAADHPSFARFQSNDGTYYTPATVAQISAPNLSGGRIQVVNETGRTASAWAATTAYTAGQKVLRSTGTGTESGIGLFMQCTTGGTTAGSEPTWDTTPGNTTADGTVVWTTRAIEFDNAVVTSGYSNSWTDTEDFDSGDTIRIRWADEDDLLIEATGVATADSTTSFLNTLSDDTVYNSYGIDGSTVTEYAADYPNVQVDVTDPDNVFYLDRFYAWYKYNLTLADGIRNFWNSVTATNTSNILINNSIVDIFFDNTKASSARQGDTIVIQRADGAYPQVTVTSGGGGLGFYYTGIGYSTSSGSGLDTTERNKLLGLRDFDPETDAVEGSETYQQALRLIRAEAAGEVAVSGSTVTFRDAADTKDRITATTDANGQRTLVTTDAT